MLTAELLKPARLNTEGRLWERGVEVPIDLATARRLHSNPRFKVNGLLEAIEALQNGQQIEEPAPQEDDNSETTASTAAPEASAKPTNKSELFQAIRDAADELDVDDEEAFTQSGKPQCHALEKVLGYPVSAKERDEALEAGTGQSKGKLEAEDKPARTGGVRITRRSSAQSGSQGEGNGGGQDPSTDEALEV